MKFIAVDPGQDKCGIALMDESGIVYEKSVVPVNNLALEIQRILEIEPQIYIIALGDGTGYKEIQKNLRERCPGLRVVVVEESGSTLRARRLFLRDRRVKWHKRFFPFSLFFPVSPVDEYAAVVIGEKYIESKTK